MASRPVRHYGLGLAEVLQMFGLWDRRTFVPATLVRSEMESRDSSDSDGSSDSTESSYAASFLDAYFDNEGHEIVTRSRRRPYDLDMVLERTQWANHCHEHSSSGESSEADMSDSGDEEGEEIACEESSESDQGDTEGRVIVTSTSDDEVGSTDLLLG